ncbi:MAG: MBL fold metallo-hydrolase [Ardenticatenaceae bacterium]|nr:MBL fold metallo-hydrolase [Ardenticatenaceae bacterium]
MKLHLLGTGTPILDATRPASTAMLVELAGANLLFDAGRGVTMQLLKQGKNPVELDAIFVTHHHYDHICDLGELIMGIWHNGRSHPLPIYGPTGTSAIIAALLNHVFNRDIAFTQHLEPDVPNIQEIIQATDITPGWSLNTDQWRISAEKMSHGDNLGLSTAQWLCLGYRLEAAGKVLAIGGDTVACAGLHELAQNADALVLSCYLAEAEVAALQFEEMARHIIATSGQVGHMAAQANTQSLILTHFRPKTADMMTSLAHDVRATFPGPIYIGEDLIVIEI